MQTQFNNGQMRVEFDNELVLSVINGRGSYTANKMNESAGFVGDTDPVPATETFEIAIIHTGHYLLNGDVGSYVLFADVLKVIDYLRVLAMNTSSVELHSMTLNLSDMIK